MAARKPNYPLKRGGNRLCYLPHLLGHDLLVDTALDMWLTARRILSDMAERTDEYFL
jgi:hypothetical protein